MLATHTFLKNLQKRSIETTIDSNYLLADFSIYIIEYIIYGMDGINIVYRWNVRMHVFVYIQKFVRI